MRIHRSFVHVALSGLVALLLAACSDTTAPAGDQLLQVEGITLSELDQQVTGSGAARVDITLREDGLVARRVAVKTGDELSEPERLLGLITAADIQDTVGTVTLGFGAQVTFGLATEFTGPEGDALTFEQFVGHVTDALAQGREPRVKAARRPPDAPQAPGDPSFRAAALRLTTDAVSSRIILNADRDNLTIVATPPPDAILTVLGLPVEIRVSEGLTELILDHDVRHEIEFEGLVTAVHADAGTFTLQRGDHTVVVRTVPDTKLVFDGETIASLGPVATAIEDGLTVVADGEGIVRDGEDGILAVVVRFRTKDDTRSDVSFGGVVHSLDAGSGRLTLVEGPTVQIGPDTRLKINGEPVESLERITAALEGGLTVHAFGEGVVESGSDIIQATFVRFEVDDGTQRVEFAGRVSSVNLDAGTLSLVEGPTIQVTDATTFADGSAFLHLSGVAEALGAGQAVYAEGCGTVVTEEPRVILAQVLKFRIGD